MSAGLSPRQQSLSRLPALVDMSLVALVPDAIRFDLFQRQIRKLIEQPALHNAPYPPRQTNAGPVYTAIHRWTIGGQTYTAETLYQGFYSSKAHKTRDVEGQVQFGPYYVIRILGTRIG